MLKNINLRARYLISGILILLPIILVLFLFYASYVDNNTRYTNTTTLEKFTYASGNIGTILDQMDSAASDTEQLTSMLSMRASDTQVSSSLEKMTGRLIFPARLFFYVQGSDSVYTPSEKILYSDMQPLYLPEFQLDMSKLFSTMLSTLDPVTIPLLSHDSIPSGIARIYPLSVNDERACLVFVLPQDQITEEFTKYLDVRDSDLFIYDNLYHLLYQSTQRDALIPFSQLIKLRGVGVQERGEGVITVTVTDAAHGLTCVLVQSRSVFYRDSMLPLQRIRLIVIGLIVVLILLVVWMAFFNYRPVKGLVKDITGQEGGISTNEITVIKNYYDRSIEEAEELEEQLNQLAPVVTQSLVLKLIYGQVTSQDQFATLSRYAGVEMNGRYFCALYLRLTAPEIEETLELLGLLSRRYTPPATANLLMSELPDDGAACAVMNFDAPDRADEAVSLQLAEQFLSFLEENGLRGLILGIGGVKTDPLLIADSFSEASAAAQRPDNRRIAAYQQSAVSNRSVFSSLSLSSVSLLQEAVHRGDTNTARRAMKEMVDQISLAADSMLFFQFYTANLVSLLLQTAEKEYISVDKKEVQDMISCRTRQEFEQNADTFIEGLCRRVLSVQAEDHTLEQKRVMSFILDHYKDYDLSIQSVADSLGIRRTQVTEIVREDVGVNFVQYISYLRMNEFKRLLAETDAPITELVRDVGYSDAPNFLRKFKNAEGVTAGQYRASHSSQS